MPHLDAVKEIEKRAGRPLTASERAHLEARIRSAQVWVDGYATEEEKTRLQETLPARAAELTQAQRAFLHALADALPDTMWEDDALQSKIFEVARLTPVEQPLAFKALYRVILDKAAGPKAGNLLAFLDRDFLQRRLRELPFDRVQFWKETSVAADELRAWHTKEAAKIASQEHRVNVEGAVFSTEYTFTLTDGKRVLRRVVTEGTPAPEGVLA
jgi:lysyl-tRNA synthetase class 1